MKKFVHTSHTVYELQRLVMGEKPGIVIIRETGNRKTFKEIIDPRNYRFYILPGKPAWFCIVRFPFFWFHLNNTGFEIGHPNLYLWYINAMRKPEKREM